MTTKKSRKFLLFFSILLFTGSAGFLVYYLGIQPYHSKAVQNKYREIYYSYNKEVEEATTSPEVSINTSVIDNNAETTTAFSITIDNNNKKGEKNSEGILLKFEALRNYNEDVRGWLSIPGTGIDYPVLQNPSDDDYYLTRDFEGNTDKNGSLYLDSHCNVKLPSQNIVIHGHNMESTKMMFYELVNYKNIEYYKKHPVITFDSIYEEAKWKIIGFMRVAGKFSTKGSLNYLQSDFESDEAFLDFVYQLQLRSSYYCPVDVNEKDQLLMLSTCTYEIDDYRAVVIARKVRPGESSDVDIARAYEKSFVLYPDKWYTQYGGEAPLVTDFVESMSFDEIDWYDGDMEIESAIGTSLEYEGSKYEITSASTLKYLKPISKKATDITIPTDVEINNRTFDVTEISKDAFAKATKLESIKIGNKVTAIPAKAFVKCKNLQSAIIGDAVEIIGNKAFYELGELKNIKIRSEVLKEIGEQAFYDLNESAIIKLPKEFSKDYNKILLKSGVDEKLIQ